jgi:regulator of protease activity HflC (stomatin/prohibitin superfamily)
MGQFVFACILIVAGVVAVLVTARMSRARPTVDHDHDIPDRPLAPRLIHWGGYGAVAIGVLIAILSCVTTVGTKNVGVLTTFGRPTGYLQNGLHWKAPWENVTELNDAVQTDTYASDGGAGGRQQQGATATCINVRIARQGTACVNVSIRWQIRPTGVDYLFRNYKDNDAITDNLVLRDLQSAMNEAFSTYDPLGIDQNGLSTNSPLNAASGPSLSSQVHTQMVNEIGSWIDVQTVSIPLLNFDNATQDKINQLQQQVAATRVATQAQLTAQAQAAANQALAASVSNDPNVLTDKCLNILKEAVDKGQALPAGFSCFAGSSATIAVPAK